MSINQLINLITISQDSALLLFYTPLYSALPTYILINYLYDFIHLSIMTHYWSCWLCTDLKHG